MTSLVCMPASSSRNCWVNLFLSDAHPNGPYTSDIAITRWAVTANPAQAGEMWIGDFSAL